MNGNVPIPFTPVLISFEFKQTISCRVHKITKINKTFVSHKKNQKNQHVGLFELNRLAKIIFFFFHFNILITLDVEFLILKYFKCL
jgi:hypothetical protein